MKKIKSIAIANRGEVACRIHRTCEKMGIKTVLLHSRPDIETLAYRMCDATECIGEGPSSESYLNIDHQIAAALKHKVDAIHPGFGFLSENADFAKKVREAGMIFIGPDEETIHSFGDKKMAKELCMRAGVPTIPGYKGDDSDVEVLIKECHKIGFPVIVKATAGGGGRGMRIIRDSESAAEQIDLAKSEAGKAFGNSSVFLEKYMDNSKHIEVQIFGDAQGNIHILGERECSLQRKHQKIIEETPSTSLSDEQRTLVHKYAKQIGELANYKNAGTVEFIFQDGKFFFLEVNTRLQVEHPVTEEVFGIDLVEAQILTAQGSALAWSKTMTPKGASIELRLYAENPYEGGLPSVGRIGEIDFPEGPGRRFEYGIEAGDQVTPFYDSMIAKIISTKPTRIEVISDLIDTLNNFKLYGLHTNKPLLLALLNHPDYILNKVTTQFFEKHFSGSLKSKMTPEKKTEIEQNIFKKLDTKNKETEAFSPWSQNWRTKDLYNKVGSTTSVDFKVIDGKAWWSYENEVQSTNLRRQQNAASSGGGNGKIVSPMPGRIFKVLFSVGDKIKKGDTLLVLEAMKMEHSIKAPIDGKITHLHFKQGDNVQSEDLILELEQ